MLARNLTEKLGLLKGISNKLDTLEYTFAKDSRIHDITLFARKRMAITALTSALEHANSSKISIENKEKLIHQAFSKHLPTLAIAFKSCPHPMFDQIINLLFKANILHKDGICYCSLPESEDFWILDQNHQLKKTKLTGLYRSEQFLILRHSLCLNDTNKLAIDRFDACIRTVEDMHAFILYLYPEVTLYKLRSYLYKAKYEPKDKSEDKSKDKSEDKSRTLSELLEEASDPQNIAHLIMSLPSEKLSMTEDLLLNYSNSTSAVGNPKQIQDYIIILKHCLLPRERTEFTNKIQHILTALMKCKSKRLTELQNIYLKLILLFKSGKSSEDTLAELQLFIVEAYLKNRCSKNGDGSQLGDVLQKLILSEFNIVVPSKVKANEAISTLPLLPSRDYITFCSELKVDTEKLFNELEKDPKKRETKFGSINHEAKYDLEGAKSFVGIILSKARLLKESLIAIFNLSSKNKNEKELLPGKQNKFRNMLAEHHIYVSAKYKLGMHELTPRYISPPPDIALRPESRSKRP